MKFMIHLFKEESIEVELSTDVVDRQAEFNSKMPSNLGFSDPTTVCTLDKLGQVDMDQEVGAISPMDSNKLDEYLNPSIIPTIRSLYEGGGYE